MRAVAILMMAGQLVGTPISAVRAHARTADSLSPPSTGARRTNSAGFEVARESARSGSLAFALEAGGDSTRVAPGAPARFPEVAVPQPSRRGRGTAYLCAAAGVGLIASSFALHDLGDRRYRDYLSETNPDRIDSRWRATVHADQLSTASLLAGEGLLATAAYLRFVRRQDSRVSWRWSPTRTAVAVTW